MMILKKVKIVKNEFVLILKMCKNSLFPNEIYENILKYTTIEDLYNFILVSKNWKQICTH